MMRFQLFTLAFDPITERFNDEAVQDFLADKEVESISDHFFVRGAMPYLTLVVCYRPQGPTPSAPVPEPKGGRQRDESWRDALGKDDWPLFNTLRDWRGEKARAEGIPPYVICNNRQLTEVVSKRPKTLAELGHIDGFGDAKLKKYGPQILSIIARAGSAPPQESGHAAQ